jgi:hypothetical protein
LVASAERRRSSNRITGYLPAPYPTDSTLEMSLFKSDLGVAERYLAVSGPAIAWPM